MRYILPKRQKNIHILSHLPLRELAQRGSFGLLVGLGVMLLILSKTSPVFVASLRMAVTDALLPVVEVVASPLEAVNHAAARGREWVALGAEVRQLRAENAHLRQQQLEAVALLAENKALRDLMRSVPGGQTHYVTARLVADHGGPFVNAALIGGGQKEGIRKNQAVIGAAGLVGRVVEAGDTSARVLLLTDVNSRVPVMGEISREKAILTGDNSAYPVLSYLSNGSRLRPGERIVTSGDGGVFPPGVVVGEVGAVEKMSARVKLAVDYGKLEYVTVIDYRL